MSEYQYYEFLAIDRPLTKDEINELRSISTRATITPVSFINEYNWGDFKGNPDKLMQRYFDTHVYVANWMSAIFMVRLPIEALSEETAQAVSVPYMLDINATRSHWIITWSLRESEDYDRFGMEEGSGWMVRLAPVRDELLRGDLRGLYIGWLAAVSGELMDDDELEPNGISSLGSFTAAQQALAEFLDVDPDLLVSASMDRPATQSGGTSEKDMDKWIDSLARGEVNPLLKQLLEGKGKQAERVVRSRFAAWERSMQADNTGAPRRKVGELRQSTEKIRQLRLEKQEHARKQDELKRRKARESHLKELSNDFAKVWESIRKPVERGTGGGYDEACRALVDIAEAYALFSTGEQFQKELKKFMADHLRRKALIQRLAKAGIWKD